MCTLILGRDVLGPGTMVLGANRDEDPDRPSNPPLVLHEAPRVVGGRDQVAGGTWLAVREQRGVVALLNRRDRGMPPPNRRSRGLLTLDAAATAQGGALSAAVLETARASVAAHPYAAFTLVFASPEACWALVLDGGAPRQVTIEPGWHVLTHRELDDPDEPRTRHLLAELSEFRPAGPLEAEDRLIALLGQHGDHGHPAVCLHEGRMVTVSSTLVRLGASGTAYRHAEGRPCVTAYVDHTALLEAAVADAPSRRGDGQKR